jgi:hydroxypyruvate isomerase
MPRLAANLSMLFTERPFMERFAAAAAAGFQGVEYLFPYAYPALELAAELKAQGLSQVLHNLPAGDWEAGERGIACLPGREEEFRAGVERAIVYAQALGCRQLNCLVGITPAAADPVAVAQTLLANLGHAALRLQANGIRLLIEPLNHFDVPGFHLCGSAPALRLIEQLGSGQLYLQYDIYHMQRMEGELAATIARCLPHIAHIQLADNPGRHEPGSGEINYPWLLRHIDSLGYQGWIGCEYKPAGRTEDGLGWFGPWSARQA